MSHCTTFIREPTWVAVAGFSGFEARKFSDEEKKDFLRNPEKLTTFRRWLEHNANKTFPLFLSDGPAQSMAKQTFESTMKEKLQDADLESKLIPEWAVGCRRLVHVHARIYVHEG